MVFTMFSSDIAVSAARRLMESHRCVMASPRHDLQKCEVKWVYRGVGEGAILNIEGQKGDNFATRETVKLASHGPGRCAIMSIEGQKGRNYRHT